MLQREKVNLLNDREYYELRSLMGNNWAIFFVLIGAREAGKSYQVMKLFLKDWKKDKIPFWWLRLSDVSTEKMLANNADKFVDADLKRKFNLDLKRKKSDVYDNGKKMATVLSLSGMAKDKGVALFDKDFLDNPKMKYNIAIDEFQPEKGEKKYFDIVYNLVNQLENIARSTKNRIRVFFMCNALEEASDVLTAFNFIPEDFGIYKIRKKRCVMHYVPLSTAYIKRREGTIADLLLPSASNFSNKIDVDKTLVYKGRLNKPIAIIKFSKDQSDWFTVWNQNVVCKYNGEKILRKIPMRPYLDELFDIAARDAVIAQFDMRFLYYKDLITQKLFQKQLELLKPRK